MLHLCIDSEILAAAAAVWLRLSGRNQMPNKSQTETCVEKVGKTLRKINIFRLDLLTEDAAIEKPFANVPFYSNKTHILEINSDIAQRPHGPHRAHLAHSCRTCAPYFVDFHHAKKITCPRQKKTS